MNAGKLNSRITILHKVKTKDKSGATVHEWRRYRDVWANVRHVSGSETVKADVLSSSIRASMRIRFVSDITPDMRVLLKSGAEYEIKAVMPDLVGRNYCDLVCESVTLK